MEVKLTNANFDEVMATDMPVLVDFWAAWCGPCQMVLPIIAELADEYEGKAKICKVNVDEEGELARRFGIASIPTVMLFKNGEVKKKLVGAQSFDDYADLIDEYI
ncbi:MAG: thioredoxin [Clostridiales bacterium]|nr:thioredoxin [Clostridiales bacterium]